MKKLISTVLVFALTFTGVASLASASSNTVQAAVSKRTLYVRNWHIGFNQNAAKGENPKKMIVDVVNSYSIAYYQSKGYKLVGKFTSGKGLFVKNNYIALTAKNATKQMVAVYYVDHIIQAYLSSKGYEYAGTLMNGRKLFVKSQAISNLYGVGQSATGKQMVRDQKSAPALTWYANHWYKVAGDFK